MKFRMLWAACAACLLFAALSFASSTIKLKDGSVVIGEFKKLGNSYSVVMSDGTRRIIPAGDIVSIDGKSPGATAGGPTPDGGTPAAGAAPTTPDTATPTGVATGAATGTTTAFRTAKSKADRVDAPIVALQVWDDFLAKNPTSPDLAAAKSEREVWNKLYKDNAEKVKGKWLGGKELVDLKKKCDDMYREAVDPSETLGVKGVQGLKKLDEIIAIYPRHFGANYDKGLYNLKQVGANRIGSQGLLAKAIQSLETTTQIAPTVPEVWANLAIGYNFHNEFQKSVEAAYRAVKIRGDDKDLLQTLANALYNAPPNFREANPKVREINTEARILFEKFGVKPTDSWTYQRPRVAPGDVAPDDISGPAGVQWSGSGFFISDTGYLITNHHVAAGEPGIPVPKGISWRVRLDDGTEVAAKLVDMDDKADIALMKVDLPHSNSFLKIAQDNPEQGEEAMVLGYPATGSREMTLQISKGTVKSVHPDDEHNIWFDLNTTHGNSGGPIVDREGNVIGILTAGGKVYDMVLIKGVGPKQIEDFLGRIADKAPKIAYSKATVADGVSLDSQRLTRECRKGTVLVLAVRGVEGDSGAPGATTQPAGAEPPADTGGDPAPAPGPTPGGKRKGPSPGR